MLNIAGMKQNVFCSNAVTGVLFLIAAELAGSALRIRKGKNAVQARNKLTYVYGEGVLTVRQCQNLFAKFRSGNFLMSKMHHVREGRLKLIKTLVDANWRKTTHEIGLKLNLSNSTVYDPLKGLGLSSKLDVWVPRVLTERNLCRRIDVCD
ncbi:histone-lysine N-methyltransferase SETMAR [Trichonephila clavipes]|nr:histone-lysine N-methyltransferase SETMAR [Trichonephila clavipes]